MSSSFTTLVDPVWGESLDELAELQRSKARDFATESTVLARLESRTVREDWQAEQPYDSLLMEVAGTALIGQSAAHSRIEQARHLTRQLPLLHEALTVGKVFVPQARVLIEETTGRRPSVCAEVERRILPAAQTHAPGPLRKKVRAIVLAVDAEESARRAAAAKTDRKTWSKAIEDGQALFVAKGPAERLQALQLRIDAEARGAKKAGDPRTLEQLRFDLLCDATIGTGKAKPLQALLHVPVATALGLSDEPGLLEGHGPLCAATTRELLADAELRKVCVDSQTGRVVGVDPVVHPPASKPKRHSERSQPTEEQVAGLLRETLLGMVEQPLTVDDTPEKQHDPSAALARAVRLRDIGCDGPGCSMQASRCELDHNQRWPQGTTSFANLRSRSPRCHHAKHAGWTVKSDPDGTSHWTSPGGRTYTVPTRDRPPPDITGIPLPTPHDLAARDRAVLRGEPADDEEAA